MALPHQITALRSLVDDLSGEDQMFSDEDLSAQLDVANGDTRLAASTVWSLKAARYSNLVDVTEGSSSRKLGSLYKNALEMSKHFADDSTTPGSPSTPVGVSRTRAITRPVA